MNGPVAAPGRELFVYYRVAESTVEVACAAALAMQANLCAANPGLRTRLLRRPEAADGRCTLMETYASAAGVGTALQAAIAQAASAALAGWQLGERHTEVFLPCA